MIVPDICLSLLKEQRTCYVEPARQYGEELARTMDGMRPYLPAKARRVLDIGCGMAGISGLLSAHYGHGVDVWLLDKQGVSEKINAGFNARAEDFAHYHDFGAALSLLRANGVPEANVHCCDIARQVFPRGPFDVVVSLLSWGFHYPIATYSPDVVPGGVIIADIRRGTDGKRELAKHGPVRVIHEAKKFERVAVLC